MKRIIFTVLVALLFGGPVWAQDADSSNPLVSSPGGTDKRNTIKNKYIGYLSVTEDLQSAHFFIDTNFADVCLDPNITDETTGATIQVRRVIGAATAIQSFVISFGSVGQDLNGGDCGVLTFGSYYIDATWGSDTALITVTGRES